MVFHRPSALGLRRFPSGDADPEILPAGLDRSGFVLEPSPATLVLELHHGEIGARRTSGGSGKSQCADRNNVSLHVSPPYCAFFTRRPPGGQRQKACLTKSRICTSDGASNNAAWIWPHPSFSSQPNGTSSRAAAASSHSAAKPGTCRP